MNFNEHSRLLGQHAFLGASNYHWLNYTSDKLSEVYSAHLAKMRGTELHDFAAHAIKLGIKLPKTKKTLNMYVNDAIGFRLTPEQPLYYSDNCFGTADTIGFYKNHLQIHDLKTGKIKASMEQLKIYAALFCLEYKVSPLDISIELRIYQSDEILIYIPDGMEIRKIMDIIIEFDKKIEKMKTEV